MPTTPRPKQVLQKPLIRTGVIDDSQLPYIMIDRYVTNVHTHLAEMNILVIWHYGLKPDRDGKLILGRFDICDDVFRQITGYAGKMTLNFVWWHNPQVINAHREALVDHELCHPRVLMDEVQSIPKVDEIGNIRYYNGKHDIEEFSGVVERHGIWKADLEKMARVMYEAMQARGELDTEGVPINLHPTENVEQNLDNLPV